ncbi:LuxR C-terminal-related transcriptional regulator [Nocardia sp. NPDC058666]|uniref:LuxR C-terminal-related transcriptional regulator n=1 Tax=unclassified Nocardia TaxID=2637762 RepID=UPI003669FE39
MISAWPLVGRDEELRTTAAAIRGNGGTAGLVLAGAAGVGKTRLARDALGATDARVHWAVATASARGLPLGCFADVCHHLGSDPMQLVHGAIAALTVPDDPGAVVVAVDDAHLLDDLSAFLVHQLVVRRLATVLLTVRTGMPAPDAITALWKDRALPLLELQPLGDEELQALLEAVLAGPVEADSARRIWSFTQGNALYTRELIDSELTANRLHRSAGVWIWHGQPTVSRTLRELIDSRMGTLSAEVADVVDIVALGEPLDATVLSRLTNSAAIEAAETQGLIIVTDDDPPRIRLAHPLFGEVRRSEGSTLRFRRLAGLLAAQLGPSHGRATPQAIVARADLTLESDLPPDPELFAAAAAAALEMLDPSLAVHFAEAAWQAGERVDYQILHAKLLMLVSRGRCAETAFARLAGSELPEPDRVEVASLRAANLVWMLGRPRDASAVLDAADVPPAATVTAIRASADSVLGRPHAAIEAARTALRTPGLPDFHMMMALGAQVLSFGATGAIAEAGAAADRGFELAARSGETAHFRFWIGALYARALRLAGLLTDTSVGAQQLRSDALDAPGLARVQTALLIGHSHLALGRLDAAIRSLREALAGATAYDTTDGLRAACLMWLAEALAETGDSAAAAAALAECETVRYQDFVFTDTAIAVARAWTVGAEGATSHAVAVLHDAADAARERGQLANEVMCLQVATQFGDCARAARLAELAALVQGPRARAAAAHAAALATADGEALAQASRSYEAMGDAVAAADAAAQASTAFTHAQRRGSALTAQATSHRLAEQCRTALTPAIRALSCPEPLTGRQREIVALAAQGLSNREIAQRLTVSVRTVEGHLYRASQRTGAVSREELGHMLLGRTLPLT